MLRIARYSLPACIATIFAMALSVQGQPSSQPSTQTQPATAKLEAGTSQEKSMTQPSQKPVVVIETSMGTIKAELWPDKAPETVKNFLAYAGEKHYDGTIFHRVMDGFMIQGGGFTADMRQKSTKSPIKNEARADTPNARGTLAMARTNVIDSATSQFFINLVDNQFLNHRDNSQQGFGYCVFGKVIEGMNVVDKIAKVKTGNSGPHQNVPVQPVEIKSITIAK